MERIKHIKETQSKELLDAQTNPGETDPRRDVIEQQDKYDQETETRQEQIAVRETLNSLNEDVLKEVFSEYFRRSGSDEETMNWIPLADVRIIYESPEEEGVSGLRYGSYSRVRGVSLFSQRLWDNPDQTLWTLIHEQCHAVSQDNTRFYVVKDEEGNVIAERERLRSGVATEVWTRKIGDQEIDIDAHDWDINEGITQLLTEKIFREYINRTGSERYRSDPLRPDKKIANTDEVVAKAKFGAYERNWQNLKLYVRILSAVADVPEDVVENAVIRTYVRNGQILLFRESEAAEILSSVNPKIETTLFGMIKSVKGSSPSLSSYVEYLSEQDIPEDIRQKIITALYRIREEWGEAYKLAPYVV